MRDEIIAGEPEYDVIQKPNGKYSIELANEVVQEATELNKANLLDDNTASLLNLDEENATVNNALKALSNKIYLGLDKYHEVSATISTSGTTRNLLELQINGFELVKNQRIMLDISNINFAYETYLNINNTGEKLVDVISVGMMELFYDGEKWRASIMRITQSGTYDLGKGRSYLAVVVGGGGGAARRGTTHYASGGGGAIVWGMYTPTSETTVITVGSGGAGAYNTASTSNNITGSAGGISRIGNLTAYGGTGAVSTFSSGATPGKGGTFYNGVTNDEVFPDSIQVARYGGAGSYSGTGSSSAPAGSSFFGSDGVYYGTGGSARSTTPSENSGTDGVVLLYAL